MPGRTFTSKRRGTVENLQRDATRLGHSAHGFSMILLEVLLPLRTHFLQPSAGGNVGSCVHDGPFGSSRVR